MDNNTPNPSDMEGLEESFFSDIDSADVSGIQFAGVSEALADLDLSDPEAMWKAMDSGMFGTLPSQIDGEALPTMAVAEDRPPSERGNPSFDWFDFDRTEEQLAFMVIKQHITSFCRRNAKFAERDRAAQFLFVRNQTSTVLHPKEYAALGLDRDGVTAAVQDLTLADFCRTLNARPHVLQVRCQYQLYQAQITMDGPLPMLATNVPDVLANEIVYHLDEDALDVAQEVWRWPGLRADLLLQQIHKRRDIAPDKAKLILQRLEERNHVALWGAYWWFTGRNPSLMSATKRAAFRWSERL